LSSWNSMFSERLKRLFRLSNQRTDSRSRTHQLFAQHKFALRLL
jgi:hypothetical protein